MNNRTVKIFFITILLTLSIITYTSCSRGEPVSKTDFCLDTMCEITIYDDIDPDDAEEILRGAFSEIDRCERLLSRTISDSDVAKINGAGGASVEIEEETAEVLLMADEISEISGGAFDITTGIVSELWDFKNVNATVPADEDITGAVSHVDYKNVILSDDKVSLTDAEAQIDLGGIAKGYIADRAVEYLESKGIKSAIVNLGGNVAVIGKKQDGSMWKIGIERPFTDRKEIIGSVEVSDATVVTSGIYERNFTVGDKIYHHVLDPKTGYPAKTDLESVTITAAKGQSGFCDALSTACLVSGLENAVKLMEYLQEEYPEKKLEAVFIDNEGNIVQTERIKLALSEE